MVRRRAGVGGIGLGFNRLALLSDGSVVGVGYKHYSTLMARFSSSGTLEWQHSIGGGFGYNELRDVAVIAGDQILACGSKGAAYNGALALFKYDASGAHLWTSMLDGTLEQTSRGAALAFTPTGRAVVVGYRSSGAPNAMALAQFDAQSGAIDWSRYHDAGGAAFQGLSDVVAAPDGVIWCAGARASTIDQPDTVVLRVSPAGDVLSSTLWPDGQLRPDSPQAIHLGSAGQVWCVVVSGAAPRDIALLQLDSLGGLSSQTIVDLGADEIVAVSSLAPGSGLIVAGGTDLSGDDDVLALRFDLSDAPTGHCTSKLNSLGARRSLRSPARPALRRPADSACCAPTCAIARRACSCTPSTERTRRRSRADTCAWRQRGGVASSWTRAAPRSATTAAARSRST